MVEKKKRTIGPVKKVVIAKRVVEKDGKRTKQKTVNDLAIRRTAYAHTNGNVWAVITTLLENGLLHDVSREQAMAALRVIKIAETENKKCLAEYETRLKSVCAEVKPGQESELQLRMVNSAWAKGPLEEKQKRQLVTIRMNVELLDYFRGMGEGYQDKINQVLQLYKDAKKQGV